MTQTFSSRVLGLALAVATAMAPVAGASAAPAKKKAAAAEAAPATDGKTVALLRFTGGPPGDELRIAVQSSLADGTYTVKNVALDLAAAGGKVKCKAGAEQDDACLSAIGKWLNANPKTAADYIVWGDVSGTPPMAHLGVYDAAKNAKVDTIDAALVEGDLIAPIVVPQALTRTIDEYREPPPPATDEEKAVIATLDEPEKTPEEIAAEKRELDDAQKAAAAAQQDAIIDTSEIKADLDKDFEAFCRTGPRKKRASKEDPKDLRPKCQRGKFFGYWQPRAWVALGLTTGLLAATGVTYGLALAARSNYTSAVDDLDAFNAMVGGDPTKDPNVIASDGQSYDALATEVSRTGSIVRRRAIIGDVLLGTSVLMAGVLTIMIFQDRTAAKRFIEDEKRIRSISDLRVGPMIGKDAQGMGASFRF